jgi:hypothetical protein
MVEKPRAKNSESEKELDQVAQQFDKFDKDIKEMTVDRMNMAPKLDVEPQTNLSQREIDKTKDIYLKPKRAVGSKEKFNEDYREQYNHSKEYVQFMAQNHEILGENIEMWTKPFAGMPAEEWVVPVNKPVWAPRYVAEQISRCKYHRLVMQDSVSTGGDHRAQFYGQMAVDTTINRLDAMPVNQRRSVFMGAKSF